jgi:hypothetical protein
LWWLEVEAVGILGVVVAVLAVIGQAQRKELSLVKPTQLQ